MARGVVAGQAVEARVDSPWAQTYLEDYVVDDQNRGASSLAIDVAIKETAADPYSAVGLGRLSDKLSVDTAALFFASTLYQEPDNRYMQDRFHTTYRALMSDSKAPFGPGEQDSYIIAFVPGYGYKRNTTTGGDFSRQRALLADSGVSQLLIETHEMGTV